LSLNLKPLVNVGNGGPATSVMEVKEICTSPWPTTLNLPPSE
jgi:hypothetical protein